MALTAEEQARLLSGQIPGGILLTPPKTGYRYGAYSPEGMVHTQGMPVAPVTEPKSFAEWVWGFDPTVGLEEPSKPIPSPQVVTGAGGGAPEPPPLPPPLPKESKNPDTPSSISAYRTKDGKVFFTNKEAPEGATKLDYNQGLDAIHAPKQGGGFIFAQQSPEDQQLESLRDALLKQRIAEASMTPEDKIQLQIKQQQQLGAAQSETKLSEMKKLGDMLTGGKMIEGTPMWTQIYKGVLDDLRKKNPKQPEEQLAMEAKRMTNSIADQEYAQNLLKLYMIQNRSQMLPVMGE